MIYLKSPDEIEKMSKACSVVAEILGSLKNMIKVGITTKELETFADERIKSLGGIPAFKGYRGFPASICASVNEEVVHGIPSASRRLNEGDIVSIDLGVYMDGFYGDGAVTVQAGSIDNETSELLKVTEEAP